jgi:hypothetical protein
MKEDDQRYFLDRDEDGHWYLIPASHRVEWEDWLDIDPDDPSGWEEPEFVQRIGTGPCRVTFQFPKVE